MEGAHNAPVKVRMMSVCKYCCQKCSGMRMSGVQSELHGRARDAPCCVQEGTELLPFLEGLSPLAARLPAREAASAAQHLQAAARPFKPQGSESESSWISLCTAAGV